MEPQEKELLKQQNASRKHHEWGFVAWDGTLVLKVCPSCHRPNEASWAVKGECESCGYLVKPEDLA